MGKFQKLSEMLKNGADVVGTLHSYEVDDISPLAKMTRSGEMREPSYYILGKYLREKKDEVE